MNQRTLGPGGNKEYYQKVLALLGGSIIGYWPLWDLSGVTAVDISGNKRDGTHRNNSGTLNGVALGAAGIGDGRAAVTYDGSNGLTSIYSTGLAAAFNGQEGSFAAWVKFNAAAAWTDTLYHVLFRIQSVTSDQLWLVKSGSSNGLYFTRVASGQSDQINTPAKYYSPDWFHIAVTWSKSADQVCMHCNGYLMAPAFTGVHDWTGSINTTCLLGANTTAAQYPHIGSMAHAVLTSRALSASEIIQLSTLTRKPGRLLVIGDSISVAGAARYPELTWSARPVTYGVTRAVSGARVVHDGVNTDMADEVAAAAADNANIIVVLLGTNDIDTTDGGFRTVYQAGLTTLKTNHPNAQLVCLGILPRTTDMTNVGIKNGLIQTAAANVGAAYVDTSTWIDPVADTLDGLHPNDGGHIKIKNQLLTKIP